MPLDKNDDTEEPGSASSVAHARSSNDISHMLPSPPEIPPPIELRIENALRQTKTRPDSAGRRRSLVIGQAPSFDDEQGITNSWKHNSMPGPASLGKRADEEHEERLRAHEGWRWSSARAAAWASNSTDGPGSASSWNRDWKSGVGIWHAHEEREGRQREQEVAEGWHWSSAWAAAWASSPTDGPGSASSWDRDWKSGGCVRHTYEGRETRQREQENNHHGWRWTADSSSGWHDEPGAASSWQHGSKSEVDAWHADEGQSFEGPGSASSDDRKASLQEAMRKWAEQASLREDKALDIARKSKAKRQREGGDAHRAWLDKKYLKRVLKRLEKQSSSSALAPGSASADAR